MTCRFLKAVLTAAAAVAGAGGASAFAQSTPVGIVSHLNLVSDKSPDISSLEAWKKSYITDSMSEQDKAIAIFNTLVRYRHQANPPKEYLTSEEASGHVHDPLKSFHVYGYGQCCCAASEVIGLAQYLGLEARGRDISRHSVPEICYAGGWHLVDGSVMNYHIKDDGQLASVDEIHDAVIQWSKEHPDLANDDKKLRTFAKNQGWKNGPELLSKADKFYGKNGVNTAGWHGWPSTMQEYYEVQAQPHDFCVTMGYQLNVQLRPGEKITRNFFSRGIEYTNHASEKHYKELLDRKVLGIQTELGDRAPGRISDGTIEWNVPMAQLKAVALASDDSGFVLRFPSSYVYVKSAATVTANVAAGGAVVVSFSDNNGLDFKPLATIDKSGEQLLDLTKLTARRYEYRLKFELHGSGTAVHSIRTINDFQCSQAALPIIVEGDNQIHFNAGPQEGTVTIEGSTETEIAKKNEQLTIADFHPVLNGMGQNLHMTSAQGDATFTIATPGDISRLRLSAAYRARADKDGYDVQLSYDNGKNFTTVPNGHLKGGTKGASSYVVVNDIPAATKQAQVRLAGKQAGTTLIFDLRIDADYKEPAGGIKPVKITYNWDEAGQSKSDVHVASNPAEDYAIKCGPGAVVKSYTMELVE
jgi:hypothetical protein